MESHPNIHDCEICAYEVNVDRKTIVLHAKDGGLNEGKNIVISFSGVLSHNFDNVIYQNVIFDIDEADITYFLKEYSDLIQRGKNSCWPIYYETEEDLIQYLKTNSYKIFCIYPSIGLNGIVIAKGFKVEFEHDVKSSITDK